MLVGAVRREKTQGIARGDLGAVNAVALEGGAVDAAAD